MATSPPSSKVDGRTLTQYEFLNVYGALYINGVQFNPTPEELANYNLIQSTQDWLDSTTDAGGGVRQLEAGATYFVNGTVIRSFPIQANGFNVITGNYPANSVDFYTGTGESILLPNVSDGIYMEKVSFAGGDGLNSTFINAQNSAGFVIMDNALVLHDNFGTLSSFSVVITNTSCGLQSQSIKNGIVWNATNGFSLNIRNTAFNTDNTTTGTMIDTSGATGILSGVLLSNIGVTDGANATGIAIAPNSGGHAADARSFIEDGNFSSLGTAITGYSTSDLQWDVTSARGIQPTIRDGYLYQSNDVNSLTTVLDGTPTAILGAYVNQGSSQFTADTDGKITYNGLEPIRVPIDLGLSVEPNSGNNVNYNIYIYSSAAAGVLQNTRSKIRVDNTDPKPISTFTQLTFNNGDWVQPYIEGVGTTTSAICRDVKFRVN